MDKAKIRRWDVTMLSKLMRKNRFDFCKFGEVILTGSVHF